MRATTFLLHVTIKIIEDESAYQTKHIYFITIMYNTFFVYS